jgi:hypothetical protein
MTKNLLNDRRFLDELDSAVGGKEKVKRPPSRATEMGTVKKQRDKTRRTPKEY